MDLNWLFAYETPLRLGLFAGVLGMLALAEALVPRRALRAPRTRRWPRHLLLLLLNNVVARVAIPLSLVAVAEWSTGRGWGLLPLLPLPPWVRLGAAVVLLDLAIYAQHAAMHSVPWLWRWHAVHHADIDFDVTTAIRFHTVEILLSKLYKLAVILLLGTPPLAVLAFEILLNVTAMFSHANVRIPNWLDFLLRTLVVTPDMHRVHHSQDPREMNRNFGFCLPWWDWIFRTYKAQPSAGHAGMSIGIRDEDPQRATSLLGMLRRPFQRGKARG